MNRELTVGGLALLLTAAALAPSARAGGVHDIALTAIPVVRSPITVDGSLSDWPDTYPAAFVPLDPGLATDAAAAGAAGLGQLRRRPVSADIQACYDSKALYFGVTWKGTGHQSGGLTLHVQTDRIAHLRIAPTAAGCRGVVQVRRGDASGWHAWGPGSGFAVATRPDGTTIEEVRIPWAGLTGSGAAPATLTLAADLEWPQITTAFLRQLPTGVRHDNTHLTDCFLTSPEKLFTPGRIPGQSRPTGATLKFVAGPHANATQTSAAGDRRDGDLRPPCRGPSARRRQPERVETQRSSRRRPTRPACSATATARRSRRPTMRDFLYIAAHVKSPGGPLNTQPEATQAGYLGGDCLQVRLNDGQHTVNLCGWYDSARKKPALTADGNDLKDPYLLQQGAKEAFQTDAGRPGLHAGDGGPLAGAAERNGAPKPGTPGRGRSRSGGPGLNPQFTALAQATLAQGGGIAYSYRLPAEANVTLGVFDAQGHLVRSLVKDAHRRAGRNTEYWDGKDQFGSAVAARQISGAGHRAPADHAVSRSSASATPAARRGRRRTGAGDWLSDEAAPQAAVTDGTNVYLAAPGSEKGHSIIAVGPDGKRLWGHQESIYPRCVSLALPGQYLYALYSGPETVHASAGGPNVVGRAFLVCLDKNDRRARPLQHPEDGLRRSPPGPTWTAWPACGTCASTRRSRPPATKGSRATSPTTSASRPRPWASPPPAGGCTSPCSRRTRFWCWTRRPASRLDTIPVPQPVGLHALPDGQPAGHQRRQGRHH